MNLKQTHGFSILTVVIISTVVALLSVQVTRLMMAGFKGVKRIETQGSRDRLFEKIATLANSKQILNYTFQNTITTDPYFKCLSDAGGASDCNSGTTNDFQMKALTGQIISGSSASPIYYNESGVVCSPASIACPYEVRTTFSPNCGGPSPCVVAAQVTIQFEIEYLEQFSAQQKIAKLKTRTGEAIHDVASIVNIQTIDLTDQTCGAGQVMIGIQPDGSLSCANSITNQFCPPNQVMRGVNPDGTPLCVPATIIGDGDCPAGRYMNGIASDGVIRCAPATPVAQICPTYKYMTGIETDGSIRCDFVPKRSIGCASGQWIYAFDADGSPLCR